MRLLSVIAVAALLGLAACESTSTIMKTWIGQPADSMMASWGAPDLESQAGGTRILTYYGRNGTGRIVCRKTFSVDRSNKIVSVADNCPL